MGKCAVLFMVFRRPSATRAVLARIARYRPERLYIACDGARKGVPGEKEKVAAVRRVVSRIDWPCRVQRLYRAENLGCRDAVAGAVTWFFDHETEGAILEDDCLPNDSFLPFCARLLATYRHDRRVLHIGGNNPVANLAKSGYVFTRYNRIWGWATWRRAWRVFDRTIPFWPSVRRDPALVALFENEAEYRRYEEVFDLCHAGRIDTWDFQWLLCRMLHGLAIQPTRNLVRNVGFGEDASHPVDPDNLLFATDAPELDLPLAKPRFFLRDHEFDRLWSERIVAHARVPNLTSLPLLLRGRGGGPDS